MGERRGQDQVPGPRPPWAAAAPLVLEVGTVATLGTGRDWEGPQVPLGTGDALLLDFSAVCVHVAIVQHLLAVHLGTNLSGSQVTDVQNGANSSYFIGL